MYKAGSALIFVSLILSFVCIIAILFTRNSLLYYSFALDRLHHARSHHALQALAHYGVGRSSIEKNNWEKCFEKWPPPDGSYKGLIKGTQNNKKWQLKSEIFKENKSLGSLLCIVTFSGNQPTIEKWTYR